MISKMNKFLKYLTLSLTLALSACGGGGGGSSAPATPLTSAQILGATKSANSAGWILSFVDGLQSYGLSYLANITTSFGTDAIISDFSVCPNGGTYSATWRISVPYISPTNLGSWTVGDFITLNLNDCVKSDGNTYNGSETYRVTTAAYGASTLDVTITSDLTQLTVSTPNSVISSTPLTTLTFTSNDTQISRTTTWDGNQISYPATYLSSGSMAVSLSTSAGNIGSGSYTISQAKMEDVFNTSGAYTRKASLVSSEGTYNNVVLKNIAAKESNNGVTTAYPKYLIAYANAAIIATVSSGTTTLSGENSDGSSIYSFVYYKYFD